MLWRLSLCGLDGPEKLNNNSLGEAIMAEAQRRGIPYPSREPGSTMTLGDEINFLVKEFNTFVLEQALTDYCYPEPSNKGKPTIFFHENDGKIKSIFDTPGALAEQKKETEQLERLKKFNEEHGI
jgi:hypothetical protein